MESLREELVAEYGSEAVESGMMDGWPDIAVNYFDIELH